MNGFVIILWLLLCQGNCAPERPCCQEEHLPPPPSPCGCGRGERENRQDEPFIPGGRGFGPFGGSNTCGCEEKTMN